MNTPRLTNEGITLSNPPAYKALGAYRSALRKVARLVGIAAAGAALACGGKGGNGESDAGIPPDTGPDGKPTCDNIDLGLFTATKELEDRKGELNFEVEVGIGKLPISFKVPSKDTYEGDQDLTLYALPVISADINGYAKLGQNTDFEYGALDTDQPFILDKAGLSCIPNRVELDEAMKEMNRARVEYATLLSALDGEGVDSMSVERRAEKTTVRFDSVNSTVLGLDSAPNIDGITYEVENGVITFDTLGATDEGISVPLKLSVEGMDGYNLVQDLNDPYKWTFDGSMPDGMQTFTLIVGGVNNSKFGLDSDVSEKELSILVGGSSTGTGGSGGMGGSGGSGAEGGMGGSGGSGGNGGSGAEGGEGGTGGTPDLCEEVDCDDENVCTVDDCAGGVCSHEVDEGAVCDDGNASTGGDVCQVNGGCEGVEAPVMSDLAIDCSATAGLCASGGLSYPITFTVSDAESCEASVEVVSGGGTAGSVSDVILDGDQGSLTYITGSVPGDRRLAVNCTGKGGDIREIIEFHLY